MEISVTFGEKELKEICGEDAIEKYRRAMNRYQTSDNETIAKREQKYHEKISAKISKHMKSSGLFADGAVDKFRITEDCYINPFNSSVTEYVEFTATWRSWENT